MAVAPRMTWSRSTCHSAQSAPRSGSPSSPLASSFTPACSRSPGWTALTATVRFSSGSCRSARALDDVAFNICAYVPPGAALVLVWLRRISRRRVGLTAVFVVIPVIPDGNRANVAASTLRQHTGHAGQIPSGALLSAFAGLLLTVSDRLTGLGRRHT